MAEPLNWRWPTRPTAYVEPLLKCSECGHGLLKTGDIVSCVWSRCEQKGLKYKYPTQVFELEPAHG